MIERKDLVAGIRKDLDEIRIIDTHEHLDTEEEFCNQHVDFGRLFLHYASRDLISAGCSPQSIDLINSDSTVSPAEKWKLIAPYWDYIRNTGYGRAVERAIRDLYEIDSLDADTVESLSEKMAAVRYKGYYREVFDKAGIALALWHRLDRTGPIPRTWTPEYDRSIFMQDLLAPFLNLEEQHTLVFKQPPGEQWRDGWGTRILCLDDYLQVIEEKFRLYAAEADALKILMAYRRPLTFIDRSRSEIEPIFNRLLNTAWEHNVSLPSMEELRAVQDYLVHFALRLCSRYHLAVKFHTGMQEGNGNTVRNSRASFLSNLFFKYPDVKFDLFHISYPYHDEAVTLVKNFPNVAVDFCWTWIVNPVMARRALGDFIDAVPANKIMGFGGDFIFIEGSYGHAQMAKDGISQVLADKVIEGTMTVERALKMAQWMLRDNPIKWFDLKNKVPEAELK